MNGENIPADGSIERVLACWGKTAGKDSPTDLYHPALYHMIDVGSVARVLLSSSASPRWKNILSTAFGCPLDLLVAWIPWAIALHDIGKISAPFQAQSREQADRLRASGFVVTTRPELYHPQVGQAFLRHECTSPIWRSLPALLQQVIIDMAGGHHGLFAPPGEIQRNYLRLRRDEPSEWNRHRTQAAGLLDNILLASPPERWPVPPNLSSAVMTLCGFTILCDWIGSNSLYFQPSSQVPLQNYIDISEARAWEAVRKTGFLQLCGSSMPDEFSHLFDNIISPRPLQQAIDAIPHEILSRPCLAILEAPTGEGKTEAALALAHRLALASGSDELYYALPTTATSNQMFERVRTYLRERLGLHMQVKLVHSQAFLMEDEIPYRPLMNGGDDDTNAVSLEWFSSKKQALLAPFGVGTIDQAELGALNVRHNALRLVGLAGKVLILDEVHAYDTYMSTIIEQLLRWLSAMGTSVILLSATLPQARRKALMEAYGVKETSAIEANGYPCVWIGNQADTWVANPPAAQPDRPLYVEELHLNCDGPREKADWLLDAAKKGGCVCWITNTVGRAQAIFQALEEIAPPEIDRTLIHSRFPMAQRQQLENDIRRKFGPGNKNRIPGIVIGTQVLEQSLDLDFDAMVSDLAPIDLLLQRAGRLHRHQRANRPDAFARPVLRIYYQRDESGELDLGMDQLIYAEYTLRLTAQVLEGREVLYLPADYRPLIEAVYTIDPPDQGSPVLNAWKKLQKQQEGDRGEARQRLLPDPHPRDAFTNAAAALAFQEDEDRSGWMVARTRLGEESVTVIPLERQGDTAICIGLDELVPLNSRASREQQLAMMRQSLKISGGDLVEAARTAAHPLPPLFAKSTLLKNALPLWLENRTARLDGEKRTFCLSLDPRLGLVITTEKGELHA